jgi:hypothetical protein
MDASDCIIQHGTLPELDCPVDEPNLLVQSLRIVPARTKREFRNASGCIRALRFVDPILTLEFTSQVGAIAGLADQHPGTVVADLANYTGVVHGFDPTDGVMVYEDPVRECPPEGELMTCNFSVVHYPHVE